MKTLPRLLPLFPLPNVVLFPQMPMPLHVFEPRYRKMVSDALDARGLIALATFQGPGWKKEYDGNPPVRPHVCLGYIARHERVEDGRYHLLLQGICRATIVREIEHHPYRKAVLRPTEPAPPMEIDLSEIREHIEELLNGPLLQQLTSIKGIHKWLTPEIPTAALVDLALMATCESVDQRYRMLEESSTEARGRFLAQQLRQMQHTLQVAGRFEPQELPDHMNLN